jgi:hypothetical protein
MSTLWFQIWRTVYRKEPITGFILTAGAANVAIGGIDQSSSLVIAGLSTVTVAIGLRWWHYAHRPVQPPIEAETNPVRSLPQRASRPPINL